MRCTPMPPRGRAGRESANSWKRPAGGARSARFPWTGREPSSICVSRREASRSRKGPATRRSSRSWTPFFDVRSASWCSLRRTPRRDGRPSGSEADQRVRPSLSFLRANRIGGGVPAGPPEESSHEDDEASRGTESVEAELETQADHAAFAGGGETVFATSGGLEAEAEAEAEVEAEVETEIEIEGDAEISRLGREPEANLPRPLSEGV